MYCIYSHDKTLHFILQFLQIPWEASQKTEVFKGNSQPMKAGIEEEGNKEGRKEGIIIKCIFMLCFIWISY